jgi:UvrD/REP helicase N-terminal domain
LGVQGHVFAVGDPDQAIYRWRGADSSKMSHSFLADFPGGRLLKLGILCECFRRTLFLWKHDHMAFMSWAREVCSAGLLRHLQLGYVQEAAL